MEAELSRPKKIFTRQLAIEIIAYLYVILFVYAAAYKLLDYRFFQVQLAHSPYIGWSSHSLAWLVPTVELIAAGMLIYAPFRKWGMYLSFLIMLCFTIYIAYLLNFSPNIPCACGGIFDKMGWKGHLLFNSVFTALGALGIVLMRRPK
ncbi:MAG: hypothetical protein EOO01_02385 [Chitinophagaceae bacterium]|nr:MAG: hypothetical protein EOO01_02385 [Chitinophagaceae bacterium]